MFRDTVRAIQFRPFTLPLDIHQCLANCTVEYIIYTCLSSAESYGDWSQISSSTCVRAVWGNWCTWMKFTVDTVRKWKCPRERVPTDIQLFDWYTDTCALSTQCTHWVVSSQKKCSLVISVLLSSVCPIFHETWKSRCHLTLSQVWKKKKLVVPLLLLCNQDGDHWGWEVSSVSHTFCTISVLIVHPLFPYCQCECTYALRKCVYWRM